MALPSFPLAWVLIFILLRVRFIHMDHFYSSNESIMFPQKYSENYYEVITQAQLMGLGWRNSPFKHFFLSWSLHCFTWVGYVNVYVQAIWRRSLTLLRRHFLYCLYDPFILSDWKVKKYTFLTPLQLGSVMWCTWMGFRKQKWGRAIFLLWWYLTGKFWQLWGL